MIIFDGKYSWGGDRKTDRRPISWWASSYNLKIIDLSKSRPDLHLIKPVVVIVSDTGEGASAVNCAQYLVKSVCRDFDLDIDRITWIEYYPDDPGRMEVAAFKATTRIGSETFYSVAWRPIRPNELQMLVPYFPEAERIAGKPAHHG
jgi:hypothetical protein